MKKLVIVCALLISAVTFAKAQGGQMGTPAERAQRSVDGPRLASLNLTADQKAKTLTLLTKLNTSSDSVRAAVGQGGDRQAMMAKMVAISGPAETTFVSWLTADQKKAYDAALAAAKEQNPNATGILMGGGRPRN